MRISLSTGVQADADVARGCVRAGLQHFIRCVERLSLVTGGHLLDGIILTAIMCGNVADIPDDYLATGAIPPDDRRKPVSVYALSKQLVLPYETVRRHVTRLARAGFCVRVGREGVVVPHAAVARLAGSGGFPRALQDLERLVEQLDRLGALTTEPARTGHAPPPASVPAE